MTDQIAIEDVPAENRFVHRTDEGDAQLVYRAEDDRLILVHTEVPESLGGRGIAGQLVKAAVERARRTGETIAPWCPYARAWIERHPDDVKGMTIDLTPPK